MLRWCGSAVSIAGALLKPQASSLFLLCLAGWPAAKLDSGVVHTDRSHRTLLEPRRLHGSTTLPTVHNSKLLTFT